MLKVKNIFKKKKKIFDFNCKIIQIHNKENPIKQKIGKKVVKDIKCFIRKVNEEAKPIRKKNSNSDDKRKLIINKKISEDEIKQIEKQSSVIEDERLRDALQKFLEKGRNKELSMLSQGWKKCSVCRAAHKEKDDICLTCKSR